MLDRMIERVENQDRFGGNGCPDCVVGEPHVCPLTFDAQMKEQRAAWRWLKLQMHYMKVLSS